MRMTMLVVVMVSAGLGATGEEIDTMAKKDDYSWIRGSNYIPSHAATNVQIWNGLDPQIVDRELGFAEKMGLNSIRVNLQYLVYERHPERFLKNVKTFVDLCEKHGIRPMFCLFDSCFGTSPSMESGEIWVACPGPDRTNPEFYPLGEKYVKDVVGMFRDDPRVLMWDVMNEPTATYLANTPEGVKQIWDFVRHFCDYVHSIDSMHPITVGVALNDNSEIIDHIDVLSMHSYNKDPQGFRDEIAKTRADAQKAGKPFIITECCAPGWGQDYTMVMPILREENLGFYVWEVMIGRTQFINIAGLFYPDGTVRSIAHVEAVAGKPVPGLVEKSEAEGGVPINSGPPVGQLIDPMLRRMLSTPTGEDNYRERVTAMTALSQANVLASRSAEVADGLKEFQGLMAESRADAAYRRVDELLKATAAGIAETSAAQAKQQENKAAGAE